MQNLIYIAAINLDDTYSGITKKIYGQFKTFSRSFNSYLIGYSKEGIMIVNSGKSHIIPYNNKHRKIQLIEHSISLIKKENIKNVYIRRFPCNSYILKMLRIIKEDKNVKILWEIPTYPYDFEKHKTIKSKIYKFIDKIYRKDLKLYIDKIVTFSDEKNIFGINCINTSNGIMVNEIRPRNVFKKNNDINLIAVAVLNNWHAYDRVIQGLYEYNKFQRNQKVYFHLIGDGPEFINYKKLINKYNLEEYVQLYGYQNKEQIEEIYDKCNLAVESLGWHRSHVNKGTSLKSREYLAKGLPIIASTKMDSFLDNSKYIKYVPENETPVNILEIVQFYHTIYSCETDSEVNEKIRKIAYDNCDMSIVMKPVIDYFI